MNLSVEVGAIRYTFQWSGLQDRIHEHGQSAQLGGHYQLKARLICGYFHDIIYSPGVGLQKQHNIFDKPT